MNKFLKETKQEVLSNLKSVDLKEQDLHLDLQFIDVTISLIPSDSLIGSKFKYIVDIEDNRGEFVDYNYSNSFIDIANWVTEVLAKYLPKGKRISSVQAMRKYASTKYEEGGHVIVECWSDKDIEDYLNRGYKTKEDLDILFMDCNDNHIRF